MYFCTRTENPIVSYFQFVCICMVKYHMQCTDLSNIKRFESSVLLQDKELVPNPASLHSLEQCWTARVFHFSRHHGLTQHAVGQKGQHAEGYRDQAAGGSKKMESVSHGEAQSSLEEVAHTFPSVLSLQLEPVEHVLFPGCLLSWRSEVRRGEKNITLAISLQTFPLLCETH